MSGEYSDGIIRAKRAVGGSPKDIIEQRFDVANQAVLYLMLGQVYSIELVSNSGQTIVIGNLIANAAGEQTITIPLISYYPPSAYTALENNISLSYFPANYSTKSGVMRAYYNDSTSKTTYLSFSVYNGSSPTQLLYNTTSTGYDVMFSFTPQTNNSYITVLYAEHEDLDFPISDLRGWSDIQGSIPGLAQFNLFDNPDLIKLYACGIFLIVWMLLFAQNNISIGLGTTFVWIVLFYWWGFLPITLTWLSIIGIISVLGIVAKEVINKRSSQT